MIQSHCLGFCPESTGDCDGRMPTLMEYESEAEHEEDRVGAGCDPGLLLWAMRDSLTRFWQQRTGG